MHGSTIGPSAYVVMVGDLHLESKINILLIFADDSNLIVPHITDVTLLEEFDHIIMGIRK